MLQEIASALELSVSTVSRIHRDAVLALAEHLREAGIVEDA
jgi:DNA-directed RNA polymerase specialized sigma subunit